MSCHAAVIKRLFRRTQYIIVTCHCARRNHRTTSRRQTEHFFCLPGQLRLWFMNVMRWLHLGVLLNRFTLALVAQTCGRALARRDGRWSSPPPLAEPAASKALRVPPAWLGVGRCRCWDSSSGSPSLPCQQF